MRNFRPLEILDGLDLLAEPAAHLRAGVAARQPVDVVLLEELVHLRNAVVLVLPGILHARVGTERRRAWQRERHVLADEVIGGGLAHLDRTVLHGVSGLERRHDLARGEGLNLEADCRSPRQPPWRTLRTRHAACRATSGKLVVSRHFNSGIDCAMAGAATAVVAAMPTPAALRNSRRFITSPPSSNAVRADTTPVTAAVTQFAL